MIYVIDTDSLITLHRNYPLKDKYFEALWNDIGILAVKGNLISTRINYEELKAGDDFLFHECKLRFKDMFVDIDEGRKYLNKPDVEGDI